MKKELIMKSHVLDILFENRNKAYGAYDLRKFYNDRLKKALGIMMLIVSGLALLTLLSPKVARLVTTTYVLDEIKLKEVALKPDEPVKKPEPVKPQVDPTPTNQRLFLSTLLIVDSKFKTDSIQTIKEKDAIGSTTTNTIHPGGPLIIIPPGNGNGDNTEPAKPVIDKTVPISDPEIMPSYPGGMEALRKFLQRNLQNPKDMEEGELVSVRIKFVVGYNGKLQSFVTVEDGGEEFNKEVIRVLKKMPDWIPGKSNGENVSVYFTIPVKFVPAN